MCGCLLHAPYWGPGPQPRLVPWPLGIKQVTLWFSGQHPTHWATPSKANPRFYLPLFHGEGHALGPEHRLFPQCWASLTSLWTLVLCSFKVSATTESPLKLFVIILSMQALCSQLDCELPMQAMHLPELGFGTRTQWNPANIKLYYKRL